MPELPEVETVRNGLAAKLTGAKVSRVKVFAARSVREHEAGEKDFVAQLKNRELAHFSRRGKFLWAPIYKAGIPTGQALVMHLGMSGQALVREAGSEVGKHVRVHMTFSDRNWELHFTDQRMFGGMLIDEMLELENGERIPQRVSHIARDALDPEVDFAQVVADIRQRSAGIKSLILNQSIISGIGNIYADEALWRARVHYATPGNALPAKKVQELLEAAAAVMTEAVTQGGTSFDAQYVDTDGNAGWFSVQLNAYGQTDQPCARCGRAIVRESWSNRSSHRCPRCQPPRRSSR
ncbi:MAG: bifunctional DNA-formamidopyrimidine glycosylase/DNA-(apurinic or apyrimidinic site) lyase [Actinomycetota bacterium]